MARIARPLARSDVGHIPDEFLYQLRELKSRRTPAGVDGRPAERRVKDPPAALEWLRALGVVGVSPPLGFAMFPEALVTRALGRTRPQSQPAPLAPPTHRRVR